MSEFRPKLWPAVGAAALLAACTPGGDAREDAAPSEKPVVAAGEAGEAAGGEGGGGEAGARDAYATTPSESRSALRLAHLRGFFLVAREASRAEGPEAGAALAGQGMLEVYDPAADAFRRAGVDEAVLRKAATEGDDASLQAAVKALDAARERVGGDPAAVAAGLAGIAAGLYSGVLMEGMIDPIEYQHSRGAALSAQAELSRAGKNSKLAAARKEIDGFVALWPSVSAPEDVSRATPAGEVQAQASRIQLALSGG